MLDANRAGAAHHHCSPSCPWPPGRRLGSELCGPSRSVHRGHHALHDNCFHRDCGQPGLQWRMGVTPAAAVGHRWLRRKSPSQTQGSGALHLLLLLCFLVAPQHQLQLFPSPVVEVDCDWSRSGPDGSGCFWSGSWRDGADSGPVAAGWRWVEPGAQWHCCNIRFLDQMFPWQHGWQGVGHLWVCQGFYPAHVLGSRRSLRLSQRARPPQL